MKKVLGILLAIALIWLLSEKPWQSEAKTTTAAKTQNTVTTETSSRTSYALPPLPLEQEKIACTKCSGTGKVTCTECSGSGKMQFGSDALRAANGFRCPRCDGTGLIFCKHCNGMGSY